MAVNIKEKLFSRILFIIVLVTALVYLFPILIAVLNSFKTKGEIIASSLKLPQILSFENYKVVMTESKFPVAFINSIIITLSSIILIILISSMAGYSLARWKSKLTVLILIIFMSSMFVPFHTIMIALIKTAKSIALTGKPIGLILIYGALNSPIPILLFRSFSKSIPIEIEEAAVIEGCSRIGIVFKIVFPLLKNLSGTIAVLNALWVWNDFLLPYLILARPITVPLSQWSFYGKFNQQWHLIMAGFVVSTIPIVIFFIFMQKYAIKGITSGAVKI